MHDIRPMKPIRILLACVLMTGLHHGHTRVRGNAGAASPEVQALKPGDSGAQHPEVAEKTSNYLKTARSPLPEWPPR